MASARRRGWSLGRIILWLIILAVPVTVAIAATLPGPHRLICPACYGLREIGDRIFVDPTFTARDERIIRRTVVWFPTFQLFLVPVF